MQVGLSSIYFLHFPFCRRHGLLHSHHLSDYHHLPDQPPRCEVIDLLWRLYAEAVLID